MLIFRNRHIIFLLLLINCTFLACGDGDDKVDPGVNHDSNIDPAGTYTYINDIDSMMKTHCLNCHSTTKNGADRNGAPISINFDTYNDTTKNADRANFRIQAGTMPPNPPPFQTR